MNTNYKIIRPIGLKEVCTMIDKICDNAKRYRQAKINPPGLIVYLDEGNGRQTLARYFQDKLIYNKVLDFSGIDTRITLDFNEDNLTPFLIHEDAGIFSERYCGLEVHNISDDFAEHCYELNLHNEYIRKTIDAGKTALLMIYVPAKPGKSLERLLNMLNKEMESSQIDIRTVKPTNYSIMQLAAITERTILDRGVRIKEDNFVNMIADVIAVKAIHTADEAARFGQELVFSCDYSGRVPEIRPDQLKKIMDSRRSDDEYKDNTIFSQNKLITPIKRRKYNNER